jgi:EAL domain-containing protein (putative c-di-GMP-specific phosphodiesterase class I)
MLSKEIRGLFPDKYTYWKTSWFKQLSDERNRFRQNVLIVAYLIAITIPCILIIHDLVIGRSSLMINYFLSLAAMCGLLGYLLRTGDVKRMAPVSLLVCIVGFHLSVVLPGGQSTYFLMFFSFPQLAFLLAGVSRGTVWTFGFLVSVVVLCAGVAIGFIPSRQISLEPVQLIVGLVTYIMLFVIAMATEKMHQIYLSRTVKGLIYDNETGLPKKKVLNLTIQTDRSYVLAIIRVANFSELISIFSENLSTHVIRFAAHRIISFSRDLNYQAFRLAGADFAVLFPVNDQHDTQAVYKKLEGILDRIKSLPLNWESHDIYLVCRIGTACITPDNHAMALKYADEALKVGQKNDHPLTAYEDIGRVDSDQTADYYHALIENKTKKTFRAFYQPIINNQTGRIEWLESLMRVHLHGDRYDSIYPYLEIARSTGIYPEISYFVLENATRVLPEIACDLSINITLSDIKNPVFFSRVNQVCRAIVDYPNTLIFEILESDELDKGQHCRDFIDMLHQYGCKVAIDDFGSGYSNFVNLINLDVDIVKIDGSLIRQSVHNPKALAIIETIQRLCARSDLKTVAEFVENQSLYNIVKGLQVDYSQGYLFGQPARSIEAFR